MCYQERSVTDSVVARIVLKKIRYETVNIEAISSEEKMTFYVEIFKQIRNHSVRKYFKS